MTQYPRSVEPGGVNMPSDVAAQSETLGGSSIRSPRGLLGAIVLLLALPIAVLTQVLVGSGSGTAMHFALAVGCVFVSFSRHNL